MEKMKKSEKIGLKSLGGEKRKKESLRILIAVLVILVALCSLSSVASAAISLSCTGDPSHSCSSYDSVSSIDSVSTVSQANPGDTITVTVDWTGWHWGDPNHFAFFMKLTSGGSWEFVDSCSTFKSDSNVGNHYTMDCPITVPSGYSGNYYIRVTANDYGGYCNPGESGVDAEGSTTIIIGDDDLMKEYSVTTLDKYNYTTGFDPAYGANYIYPKTKYWLQDKNSWTKKFYWYNSTVWQTDFGTQTSGYQGLDEADYHIHFGHGGKDLITEEQEICLYEWNWGNEDHNGLKGDVAWDEVYNKWDLDSEWVFIYSCNVLNDSIGKWGAALNKGHMILGFTTHTFTNYQILDTFYSQLIDNDNTMVNSYYVATTSAFGGDVKAAAIADTEDQFYHDHLWDQGEVKQDESPNDNIVWYAEWSC